MPAPRIRVRARVLSIGLAVLVLLTAPPAAPNLAAQDRSLRPGDRARITMWDKAQVYEVVRLGLDTLVVRGEGPVLELPFEWIQRVEIRGTRGRGGQIAHDALMLGLTGVAIGAVLGGGGGNPGADCTFFCSRTTDNALLAGTALGLLGAGTGALIGAARSPLT